MNQYGTNFRAPRVDVHEFAMVPRAEIPRSSFRVQSQHKTTIDCTRLYPVYLQEVLPGDSFNVAMTAMVRLATPLFPVMDNIRLESFFFFVPNRLVWVHWANFMGEQNNPADSISYSIPQIVSPVGGFAQLSIYDYFGLPCAGQTGAGNTISVSALPLRAYNLIYQEWFRDENLINGLATGTAGQIAAGAKWMCQSDDGPDNQANYALLDSCKIHDYFTSCLPWLQKNQTGGISLPLAGSATVKTNATELFTGTQTKMMVRQYDTGNPAAANSAAAFDGVAGGGIGISTTATTGGSSHAIYPTNLYADLTTATNATINSIRLAFQTQRLLERDARGGTRYTEIIRSHFGVMSPDARLMRPEYLGGGKSPLNVTPVPQTTATGLTGGTSPLGTLAAVGTSVMSGANHGFRYSATEHGYIIGLVCARREQVYQQGLRRLWTRATRYDFYLPVFAHLGEQAVNNSEIYCDGSANDSVVFGYQERWAEYRYHPSFTSGYFRSTNSTPLDAWHLATKFSSLPALGSVFIRDDTRTVAQRVLAAGAQSAGQQLYCDFLFDQKLARPMPLYSVPGLIDHF
jgi:Capsid protein (F protein)